MKYMQILTVVFDVRFCVLRRLSTWYLNLVLRIPVVAELFEAR